MIAKILHQPNQQGDLDKQLHAEAHQENLHLLSITLGTQVENPFALAPEGNTSSLAYFKRHLNAPSYKAGIVGEIKMRAKNIPIYCIQSDLSNEIKFVARVGSRYTESEMQALYIQLTKVLNTKGLGSYVKINEDPMPVSNFTYIEKKNSTSNIKNTKNLELRKEFKGIIIVTSDQEIELKHINK